MSTPRDMGVFIATVPALLLITICCQSDPSSPSGEDGFTQLTGPYLGQTPPGSTPVVFAPGIVSVDDRFEHSGAVFSPDGAEVYWVAKPNGSDSFHIYFMRSVDGRWTTPQVTAFTQDHEGNRPAFSPDGQRLYFETIRNPVGGPIVFVERQGMGWSQPSSVSPVINSTAMERPFSITADGSMYFGRGSLDSDEILVSRMVDGEFTEPVPVGGFDNPEVTDIHAFVSRDEGYMIVEETDHRANCDLAISYRLPDGTWSERSYLPFGWARFPVVSPDGDYLFFVGFEGIYWVSTSFVEDLRPAPTG